MAARQSPTIPFSATIAGCRRLPSVKRYGILKCNKTKLAVFQHRNLRAALNCEAL